MAEEARTTAPRRIRHRVGAALPENTMLVGKGSSWASPFKAGELGVLHSNDGTRVVFLPADDEQALGMFRTLIEQPAMREKVVAGLKGKNLACWCPLDAPCHADVLLEAANSSSDADA